MAEHTERGQGAEPVPRDMPDQQADTAGDRWEGSIDRADQAADEDQAAADVPDTDQAGTGRQGAPHSASVHPEQPVPDEPTE